MHTPFIEQSYTSYKKRGREGLGNRGAERQEDQYALLPHYLLCTISLKTKVKHGMTLFPCWRTGAVNTMERGLTGVQNWHKGRDMIRLNTSLSAYYFMYKKSKPLPPPQIQKTMRKELYQRTPKRSPSLAFYPPLSQPQTR